MKYSDSWKKGEGTALRLKRILSSNRRGRNNSIIEEEKERLLRRITKQVKVWSNLGLIQLWTSEENGQ